MTTIFTDTLSTLTGGFAGHTVRDELAVTGNAQGQVRVTIASASGGVGNNLITTHCSIGISKQDGTGSTVSTPVELTFGGSSGFTIPGIASITSDWVNLAGFTTSDKLIVVQDIDASASGDIGYNPGSTGNNSWHQAATASWNTATVSGYSPFTDLNIGVTLIETQAAPSGFTPYNPWPQAAPILAT